jgi:hypothetical protein
MPHRNPASPAGLTTAPPGLPLPAWRMRIRLFQMLDRVSWSFLSKISPARRIALLCVAIFEFVEVYELWTAGAARGNWIAVMLGLVVLFLLMAFELAEHAALRRDVDLSREIAEWLLPKAPPHVTGIHIAFDSRRAEQSGSDYFNAFPRFPLLAAGANPRGIAASGASTSRWPSSPTSTPRLERCPT